VTAKLIRALQRGGCTAQTDGGDWKVWRRHDQRTRAIGVLPPADVAAMRARGDLSLSGEGEGEWLIWSGESCQPAQRLVSPAALMMQTVEYQACRSLLHRILDDCSEPAERHRLARAASDFAEDIERAQTSGRASGMNWQALATGTRIQGGRGAGHGGRVGHAASAAQRLAALLHKQLGVQNFRLLEKLVVEAATRNAIACWRDWSPKQAEGSARAALCQLADAYDACVRRPERAMPPRS